MEKLDPETFNVICARGAEGLTWNPDIYTGERHRTVNCLLAENIRGPLLALNWSVCPDIFKMANLSRKWGGKDPIA
jgi:hypothetical protein